MKEIKRWIENGMEYVLRENDSGNQVLGKYPVKVENANKEGSENSTAK